MASESQSRKRNFRTNREILLREITGNHGQYKFDRLFETDRITTRERGSPKRGHFQMERRGTNYQNI